MSTEIQEVSSASSTPPPYGAGASGEVVRNDKKDDGVIEEKSLDLEENQDEDGKNLILDRADATELTPTEAFKWNVEGDQSPCTFARSPAIPFLCNL